MDYTLVLTEAMLNVISQGLMDLPFKLAAPVVAEIQAQIRKQSAPPGSQTLGQT